MNIFGLLRYFAVLCCGKMSVLCALRNPGFFLSAKRVLALGVILGCVGQFHFGEMYKGPEWNYAPGGTNSPPNSRTLLRFHLWARGTAPKWRGEVAPDSITPHLHHQTMMR